MERIASHVQAAITGLQVVMAAVEQDIIAGQDRARARLALMALLVQPYFIAVFQHVRLAPI